MRKKCCGKDSSLAIYCIEHHEPWWDHHQCPCGTSAQGQPDLSIILFIIKSGIHFKCLPRRNPTKDLIDKERDAISMVVEQSSLTCEWYLSHINYHLSSRGHHSFVISVFTSTRRCQPVRGHSHLSMLSLGHPHEPGELNVFA